KDKLYLTHARARRRGGDILPSMPSRFLETIPPGIVEEKTTSSGGAPRWGQSTGRWPTGGNRGGRGSRWAGRVRRPAPTARAASSGGNRSDGAPPPEDETQDSPRYVKGERVRHRRFGGGTIQGLTGTGRELKVTVLFDEEEHGLKQLIVAYAGLEREWDSA